MALLIAIPLNRLDKCRDRSNRHVRRDAVAEVGDVAPPRGVREHRQGPLSNRLVGAHENPGTRLP